MSHKIPRKYCIFTDAVLPTVYFQYFHCQLYWYTVIYYYNCIRTVYFPFLIKKIK